MGPLDWPTALLVLGVVVLCVTTAATTIAVPSGFWRRRGRGRPAAVPIEYRRALSRRAVTGRPATLTPIELLPAPPRQATPDPHDQESDEIRAARAFLDELVDRDPELLARVVTEWIAADEPGREP